MNNPCIHPQIPFCFFFSLTSILVPHVFFLFHFNVTFFIQIIQTTCSIQLNYSSLDYSFLDAKIPMDLVKEIHRDF